MAAQNPIDLVASELTDQHETASRALSARAVHMALKLAETQAALEAAKKQIAENDERIAALEKDDPK